VLIGWYGGNTALNFVLRILYRVWSRRMSVGSILPVMRYADPAEAAGWLCNAYGFSIRHIGRRPDGGTTYIVLRFGEDSVVVARHGSSVFDDLMVQPADVGNRSTQACYLTIQDVDQHCAHALAAGARVEIQPTDDGIGGRVYVCRDPEGHLWSFGNALVGPTLAGLNGSSIRPRRYAGLSARGAIGLAVLVSVTVGYGAMSHLGTDLAPKALTAWLGDIRAPSASSGQFEQEAKEAATKRLLASEAAVVDLTEKLQISQLEFAHAQQLKQNSEKLLNASETEYRSRLRDSQAAFDAAVRAKELASQELQAERHRTQGIQTQLDETSQQLVRSRADGSKFESRLKDNQGALDAAMRAKELASQELDAERHRAQAMQNEASQQLARSRAEGSKLESRLKDSQGALDAAVRANELASRELEAERYRAQTIQTQLDEASKQLARLRTDGGKFEAEARQLRDAMARLGEELLGSTRAGQTARDQLATAQSTEQELRERLRASEREARELELRARMAVLDMDNDAARERTAQAAESARTALADAQADQLRPRDKLRASEPATTDARGGVAAKEAARDVAMALPEQATEIPRKASPDAMDVSTPRASPRAAYVRPLPQHQLTQRKKWISVAAIKKAKTERQRQAAEAAAAARKVEEERQRVAAAEAAQKAKAERQRQAAEAAAAARKAEEERQRVAAVEAAQKAKAERQRQAAEAAAAERRAEEERRRAAAEAAQKAKAERQRQAAEAAAAARKAEEERQRVAAEAAQKAKAERERQAAEAAAAARKAEEDRQKVAAAKAAQKAEADRQRQVAEAAAAARKIEEERQRAAAVEAAQKAEAERQRQAAEAAAAARKVEEERLRVAAAESAQKAEAARTAKEAAEAKARADRETRRRTLGLTVTSEDGARYLERGRALLKTGDVTSARLFLERASNAGLADAAMELAETYDPATVTRLIAVGLVGDREQARAWYMRAQALGSSEAAERLKIIIGQ